MTEKEWSECLAEHYEEQRESDAECHLKQLAFVIHKFCGGTISYHVEDEMNAFGEIEIIRKYDGETGMISYFTRVKR